MPRYPNSSPTAASLSDQVYGILVRRAKERGLTPHPLNVGDTYLAPPEAAWSEAQRVAEWPRLHNYTPVQGDPVLLDAIVKYLASRAKAAVSIEDVQVTLGATSGLSVVTNALFDPGDEVLLPSPYWPLIRGIFASRGVTPVEIPFYDRLDTDVVSAIERAITPRTAAIYLNTPNNPTGRVVPTAIVDAIADLAGKHELWVIVDEAYAELWFGKVAPAPLWDHPKLRERAIAAHTVSKSYGLSGARVGFVHGPGEAMRAIRGLQTFQTYCAARPMQLGAAKAMLRGDHWLTRARAAYREAGRRTAETLKIDAPEGGTFVFFDARPHYRAGEGLLQFLERCLDAGVLLTPGSASGRDYADHARLCFTAVPPDALDDALAKLKTVLR